MNLSDSRNPFSESNSTVKNTFATPGSSSLNLPSMNYTIRSDLPNDHHDLGKTIRRGAPYTSLRPKEHRPYNDSRTYDNFTLGLLKRKT